MKKYFIVFSLFVSLLCVGCQTTGKLIATTSTSVDHAMRAWAVYEVDGKATEAQKSQVRYFKQQYDLAEDAAVAAFVVMSETGDKSSWLTAKEYLYKNQQNLINLVTLITGKAQ
jgi:ABC-type phosphate/phosphonate transport system ATPase subunit